MYKINVFCRNCRQKFEIEVKKGTLRPSKVNCPNCECETRT